MDRSATIVLADLSGTRQEAILEFEHLLDLRPKGEEVDQPVVRRQMIWDIQRRSGAEALFHLG